MWGHLVPLEFSIFFSCPQPLVLDSRGDSPEDRTRTWVGGSAARRSHLAECAPLHEAPAQSVPFPLDSGEAQGGELSGDVGGGDCSPIQQKIG